MERKINVSGKYYGELIRLFSLTFLIFISFTALFGTAAWAERNTDVHGLFISENTQGVKRANPAALRHRSVKINKKLLKNKHIFLNLFEDIEFDAERVHLDIGPEGAMTWSGNIMNVDYGTVHITVFGDTVAGSVNLAGELYEINPGPGGRITIEEIEVDQLPPHADPKAPNIDFFLEEERD